MSYYPPTDWMLKDFYREHAESLFRCCSFLTCGQADLQKMVQDIFLRMLSKGISFSSDKDARAWLLLTAYAMSKKPPMASAASEIMPEDCEADIADCSSEEQSADAAQESDIQEVPDSSSDKKAPIEFPTELRELSRKDRLIVVFYYCEAFRKAEIAKYLGWTTFMVRHRLRRIRKKVIQEKGGAEAC